MQSQRYGGGASLCVVADVDADRGQVVEIDFDDASVIVGLLD